MGYEMYGNNILILPEDQKKETESGIVIPDTINQDKVKGKVISVSSGYYDDKTGDFIKAKVKKNDEVFYRKNSGQEVELEDGRYLIIKEVDIFCVIN